MEAGDLSFNKLWALNWNWRGKPHLKWWGRSNKGVPAGGPCDQNPVSPEESHVLAKSFTGWFMPESPTPLPSTFQSVIVAHVTVCYNHPALPACSASAGEPDLGLSRLWMPNYGEDQRCAALLAPEKWIVKNEFLALQVETLQAREENCRAEGNQGGNVFWCTVSCSVGSHVDLALLELTFRWRRQTGSQ